MTRRQPPRLWLMTDERADAVLLEALRRLPRGSGVVFRHHATPARARRARFAEVRRIARARRLVLVLADTPAQAAAWGADGVHGHVRLRVAKRLLRTAAVHDAVERIAALRARVDVAFVSPVFATRSHPGARTLGRVGFAALAHGLRSVALGGMDAWRAKRLRGAYGWAAIDALTGPRETV